MSDPAQTQGVSLSDQEKEQIQYINTIHNFKKAFQSPEGQFVFQWLAEWMQRNGPSYRTGGANITAITDSIFNEGQKSVMAQIEIFRDAVIPSKYDALPREQDQNPNNQDENQSHIK